MTFLAAFAALVLTAEPTVRWDDVRDGVTTCPDSRALRRGVAERLGRDPVDDAARQTIQLRWRREGEGLAVQVNLLEGAKVKGQRSLSAPSADCTELARAVVLAVAIAIDPMVITRPAPVATTPPPEPEVTAKPEPVAPPPPAVPTEPELEAKTPPARRVVTPADEWNGLPPPALPTSTPALRGAPPPPLVGPPPPPPARTSTRFRPVAERSVSTSAVWLGASTGVMVLEVPSAAAPDLAFHAQWESTRVALGARVFGVIPTALPFVGFDLWSAQLGVAPEFCLRAWRFSFCAVGRLGARWGWATSGSVPVLSATATPLAAVGLVPTFDVFLGSSARLRFHAGVLVHTAATTYLFDGKEMWRTPAVSFTFGVTLSFRAWSNEAPKVPLP